MVSHIQISLQQHYSIFTINQWSGVVDRDVMYMIKQLIVIIRRKIVTTPAYDDVKQYLQDDCIYFYYNNMKWTIEGNYMFQYPRVIVISPFVDNKIVQEVEVYLDTDTCITTDEGFSNYKISLDQNLTIIDRRSYWTEYSGRLIFVEN